MRKHSVISRGFVNMYTKSAAKLVLQLYSRTLCLEAAPRKNGDLIGQQIGFIQEMGGENDSPFTTLV